MGNSFPTLTTFLEACFSVVGKQLDNLYPDQMSRPDYFFQAIKKISVGNLFQRFGSSNQHPDYL